MANKPELDAWKVLEHGPIEKLADRLWRVEGAVPGMSLRRVMTVIRRESGGLVLHSPIALADRELGELEALGKPEILLIPGAYHRLDAPRYKRRYPSCRIYAPSGSRAKAAEVVSVDGSYEDFPRDGVIEAHSLRGAESDGLLLVRAGDGLTVVFNDVVMNMDRRRDVMGYLFTTLLGSAPGPRISRLSKMTLVKNKAALRAEILRLAALPDLQRLIVSHDKVTNGQAETRAALERAASYL